MEAPETVCTHTQAPDKSAHAAERANVNNVHIDIGTKTLSAVYVMAAIIGACGVVMGLNLAKQDQMDRDFRDSVTQNKLVERRLMDIEAYAMLNGWKIPGDDTHGPTGNFQRMNPKESQNGRR